MTIKNNSDSPKIKQGNQSSEQSSSREDKKKNMPCKNSLPT